MGVCMPSSFKIVCRFFIARVIHNITKWYAMYFSNSIYFFYLFILDVIILALSLFDLFYH